MLVVKMKREAPSGREDVVLVTPPTPALNCDDLAKPTLSLSNSSVWEMLINSSICLIFPTCVLHSSMICLGENKQAENVIFPFLFSKWRRLYCLLVLSGSKARSHCGTQSIGGPPDNSLMKWGQSVITGVAKMKSERSLLRQKPRLWRPSAPPASPPLSSSGCSGTTNNNVAGQTPSNRHIFSILVWVMEVRWGEVPPCLLMAEGEVNLTLETFHEIKPCNELWLGTFNGLVWCEVRFSSARCSQTFVSLCECVGVCACVWTEGNWSQRCHIKVVKELMIMNIHTHNSYRSAPQKSFPKWPVYV